MTQPKRIQLRRTKGWRKPEGAVVVSRPSRWGNPFPVSEYGLDLSIALYRDVVHGFWSPEKLSKENFWVATDQRQLLLNRLARLGRHPIEVAWSELRGRDLACWCPLDQPCHADVLLEIANRP